jgi:selenocysteine lyase/cysteine desulfurase
MPTAHALTDWSKEWFAIDDATYLNAASSVPLPRVAVRAVEASLATSQSPHRATDSLFFDVPNRLRANLATLIGGKPTEIALTTGASMGMSALSHLLDWSPGDEVITAIGEFPLQYATWKPMEAREGITLKIVRPRDRFITADDLIDAITPNTRVVSVSHVRFDDGSLLDAARVATACHAAGAVLVLDVSQSCGAVPLDVDELSVDFLVCAGYKWLLSPHGTGFFWARATHLAKARRGPFNWAAQDADTFATLNFVDPEPSQGAKRWDAAESATLFNLNLTAMDAAVDLVLRLGPAQVREHDRALIELLFDSLPARCIPASPLDPAHRGPYGCFTGPTQGDTVALYQRLRNEKIIVSMRGGRIRVSPHVFNSTQDIARLIRALGA